MNQENKTPDREPKEGGNAVLSGTVSEPVSGTPAKSPEKESPKKERKLRGRAKKASYFAPTARGEYIYNGPLYFASIQKFKKSSENGGQADDSIEQTSSLEPAGKTPIYRMLFTAAMALCALLCGCIPVFGLNAFYVILPFTCGLITNCVLCYSAGKMFPEKLREYIYDTTVKRLPHRILAAAVFSCLTFIGETIVLFIGEREGGIGIYTVLFLFLQAAIFTLSIFFYRFEKRVVWSKT